MPQRSCPCQARPPQKHLPLPPQGAPFPPLLHPVCHAATGHGCCGVLTCTSPRATLSGRWWARRSARMATAESTARPKAVEKPEMEDSVHPARAHTHTHTLCVQTHARPQLPHDLPRPVHLLLQAPHTAATTPPRSEGPAAQLLLSSARRWQVHCCMVQGMSGCTSLGNRCHVATSFSGSSSVGALVQLPTSPTSRHPHPGLMGPQLQIYAAANSLGRRSPAAHGR